MVLFQNMNTRNKLILAGLGLLVAALALGLFFISRDAGQSAALVKQLPVPQARPVLSGEPVEIPENASPISGLECDEYNRRPIAVILAEDSNTRPLSAIGEADLVFEMSVITNEITRLMAVYVCQSPEDIGSLRSARHDFIPLAMGLDAILAHWGGSHYALDDLATGIMDNIDAMANPFSAFYRKQGIPMPHDGFTSMARLINSAEKLGYRLESQFEGYAHDYQKYDTSRLKAKSLFIDYPYPYNVKYRYQPKTNSYLRFRTGRPEIDKLTDEQIEAKNIVIMRAASRQIEGPYYNDVDVEGYGKCQIYQNGIVNECSWEKDPNDPSSRLYFYDKKGKEIKFIPGSIWINIVEPDQNIKWQ